MNQPNLDELIALGEKVEPNAILALSVMAKTCPNLLTLCRAAIPLARANQSAMEALVVSASVLESLWASEHDGTALCQSMKDGIREALELARPVICEAATDLAGMGKGKET